MSTLTTHSYGAWLMLEDWKPARNNVKITFSNSDPIASWTEQNDEPVRIISRGAEETIHYDEKRMEHGKPYPIEWYGEKFVLVKRDDKITMLAEDEV